MTRISNILIAVALLASIGCTAKAEAETPAFVNAKCPIMGNDVEADGGATTWNGKQVGFCCPKCKPKFEAMDDAAKTAALAANNK